MENYSFIVKRKNIVEGKTYILNFSSAKILSISSEENSDKSFDLNTEELKLPMCINSDAIPKEIGNQIQKRFGEEETLIIRCDYETKTAINKLAAANSIIFE